MKLSTLFYIFTVIIALSVIYSFFTGATALASSVGNDFSNMLDIAADPTVKHPVPASWK